MNKIKAIAAGALIGLMVLVGTYFYGVDVGKESERNKYLEQQSLAEQVRQTVETSVASAISVMRAEGETTRQELASEISSRRMYVECFHADAGMRALNASLAGRSLTPGDTGLPGANPANGPVVRSDNNETR